MILYKYVSSSTLLRILESSKLYCGPIASFNDPFEGQVFEKEDDFSTEAFIDEVCRQVIEMDALEERVVLLEQAESQNPIKAFVALYHQQAFGNMSQERFLELLRQYLLTKELRTGPSTYTRQVHRRLAEYVHVFCMSKNRDSLLMWAHYAEHHKGAILGFEVSDVTSFLSEAQPVIYSPEFPPTKSIERLARSNLGRGVDGHQWMATTLLTKSMEWRYEAEWRVLVRHQLLDENHLVSFPPEALRELILGCRCSADTRESVLRIASKSIQHLKVSVAEIDHHSFALHYHPVPA